MSKLELLMYCLVMIVGILATTFLLTNQLAFSGLPAFFALLFVIVMNLAQSP